MGTIIPKVNLQGQVFQEFEYVTPQDFVHFAFGEPGFEHLYPKVYLAGGSSVLMALQDVEKYVTEECVNEPDVMMDALENLSMKHGAIDEERLSSALILLRKAVYPIYKIKSVGTWTPVRVFCTLPRNLPKLFEIAAKQEIASDLAFAVRPWDNYWEVTK